jgi:hypothetical protein
MGKTFKISGGDASTLGCVVLLIVGLVAVAAAGAGGAYVWTVVA